MEEEQKSKNQERIEQKTENSGESGDDEQSIEETGNIYEDFESFVPAPVPIESPNLVLESGETLPTTEDLEAGVSNIAIDIESEENQIGEQEERVYNMPDYGRDYELQEREQEERRRIRREEPAPLATLNVEEEPLGDSRIRAINSSRWQKDMIRNEMGNLRRGHNTGEDYQHYRLEKRQEEINLPFEQKKKRKRFF